MNIRNNGGTGCLTNWVEPDCSQWMAFNEACERARLSIGAEIEPEGDSGTSALLARANDGLVALGAKRTERIFERLGDSSECRVFDQADGAIFTELLYATYHSLPGQSGGEQWSAVYINYSAGDFKFEIESKQPPFRITYSVWGMVFSRRDVEASFPLSIDGNQGSGVTLRKGRTANASPPQSGGNVPANRKLNHDKIIGQAASMIAAQPGISKGSAAASIVAELPRNPKTGKPRDTRHIERMIAHLWEGGLSQSPR